MNTDVDKLLLLYLPHQTGACTCDIISILLLFYFAG